MKSLPSESECKTRDFKTDMKWKIKLSIALARIEELISENPSSGEYWSVAVEFTDIYGSRVKCQRSSALKQRGKQNEKETHP